MSDVIPSMDEVAVVAENRATAIPADIDIPGSVRLVAG